MDHNSEIRKQVLTDISNPQSVRMNTLSVVLLTSNEARRQILTAALAGTQATVLRVAALAGRDALPALLAGDPDVLIVDLHEDSERGLDLVEAACGIDSSITVMVYGRPNDTELVVRSMRAGAREFLTDPLSPAAVTDALVRASVRRDEVKGRKKTLGKCLVFAGAKGGSGVTTIAANFALLLAQESGQSVVLVDLDLQLGDAALDLGLSSQFSTVDALQSEARLDSELVAKLLASHSSGLKVMAAPVEYGSFHPTPSSVLKLLKILQNDFDWIVVDTGTQFSGYGESLFGLAEKVYLVTQVSVTELRNSNRFISSYFKGDAVGKLEVVLNRYAPGGGQIDEENIRKALTVSPAWRIPSDYPSVRQALNTATALALKDCSLTRAIAKMAVAACGKAPAENKKKRLGWLFS